VGGGGIPHNSATPRSIHPTCQGGAVSPNRLPLPPIRRYNTSDCLYHSLGVNLLVHVQHDPFVRAAAQSARVLPRVARRVVLLQQGAGWRGNAVLDKRAATCLIRQAQLAVGPRITDAGRLTHGSERNGVHRVGLVVGEDRGRPDGADEVDGRVLATVLGSAAVWGHMCWLYNNASNHRPHPHPHPRPRPHQYRNRKSSNSKQ